ncbi:WD40-repeat-containing domain protein [Kalaharituber pfeilii]|nr:WD40-repeat-containing domain protein [Kalaharituber pfeilii]
MASAAINTPVKSHSNLFSSRTAGARMPLTPSPRARQAGNKNHAKEPQQQRNKKGEERHHEAGAGGNLSAHFAALKLSPGEKKKGSNKEKEKRETEIKLDLGVSDWSLPGSKAGQTPEKKKKPSEKSQGSKVPRKAKTTIRINGDRFIPCRGATSPTASSKLDLAALTMGAPQPREGSNRPSSSHSSRSESSVLAGGAFGTDSLTNPNAQAEDEDAVYPPPNPENLAYQSSVAAACGVSLNTRILAFKPSAPESSKPIDLRSQYNRPVKPVSQAQLRRRILTAPERVLDAPGLVDDYYLNLLDWSSSNQVAIGLERNVYVWNADSGSVSCLLETAPDTYVSSVKWSQDGAYVAVGLGTGDVQIWDVEESVKLRTMSGHAARVGVASWNKALLSTGSRSGMIFNHDVRIAEHKVAELTSHTSEVCGLEWRSDGAQLASGGNDNLVNIWDARSLSAPKYSKTNHKAAVKAIAWCPWQLNLLATGGGSYDRHIHFWNSTTGARVNSIDTGSQVTSLRWSTHYKEIVSCHGFPDNQLSVWSYPTLVRNIEIPAHETRVLHACLSPDGQVLATAASDESLKFWKLFEKKPASAASSSGIRDGGKALPMAKQMTIR